MYGALRALFLNTNYHELSMNYFMNFFVNAYSFRQFQIAVYLNPKHAKRRCVKTYLTHLLFCIYAI